MAGTDPGSTGQNTKQEDRQHLRRLLRQYRQATKELSGPDGPLPLDEELITELETKLDSLLDSRPGLVDFALKGGYDYVNPQGPGYNPGDTTNSNNDGAVGNGNGNSNNDGDGGGNKNKDKNEPIDHLPGKLGKDYHFVKGPGGQVKVVYSMDIPGPKKGSISFTIPKELYDRYNVDPDKVKTLTAAQMRKLKGFGPINGIKLRRGEHPFQSWLREMKSKFGMAPSMLRDKEVMQTLYAAHLGNWDQAQLLGELQQTKWYDNKTKERIDWLFKDGSADKKTKINANLNGLTDYVRQAFGAVDWTQHGINEATLTKWATNIASGRTGWDLSEAKSRIDEIARGVEGTSLWADEEQAAEGALQEAQEWEDIFETYRSKNISWLGPNGRSSREFITDWAKKRAAGTVSDADYDQFLREQQKTLYPYITGDRTWEQFADPYRAQLQRIMGDNASIGWDHTLLADLGGKDTNGAPTNQAMSLYDFGLIARDPELNPSAYQQGTALYDQGMDRLSGILGRLRGVTT